jgi:hypothetical protein
MLDDWQNKKNNRELVFSNREKQLVLGSLLGNSSIIKPKKSKNPHFQMRESVNKGGTWIQCKAYELQKFSRLKSFVQDSDSYRWNSISDACWWQIYDLCYENNKKNITSSWLDILQDYGLACWFMDKGIIQNQFVGIRISRLDENSIEEIFNYFKIIGVPGEFRNFGGSKTIQFRGKSKLAFMKIVGQKLPVYYRLQIN